MVLDRLILSIVTGFIVAGFVWWAGSSLLLTLAAYSLGGSVTLLILASVASRSARTFAGLGPAGTCRLSGYSFALPSHWLLPPGL